MKQKRFPERMCVACRKHAQKGELLRVVRNRSGVITVDYSGKMEGRGAYICADEKCILLARKKGCLSRAFRTYVCEEIYEALQKAAGKEGSNGR